MDCPSLVTEENIRVSYEAEITRSSWASGKEEWQSGEHF